MKESFERWIVKIKNCIEFIEYSYRALTNYYFPTINYSSAYKFSNNYSRLFLLFLNYFIWKKSNLHLYPYYNVPPY